MSVNDFPTFLALDKSQLITERDIACVLSICNFYFVVHYLRFSFPSARFFNDENMRLSAAGFLDVYIFLSRFQRFRSPKIAGANGNPVDSWISQENETI